MRNERIKSGEMTLSELIEENRKKVWQDWSGERIWGRGKDCEKKRNMEEFKEDMIFRK